MIEGIGDSYREKLEKAGVSSVESLLETGAKPNGSKEIAEKSELSPQNILRWVNHADLFRIKGIASQFAELLEASDVDSVVEHYHNMKSSILKPSHSTAWSSTNRHILGYSLGILPESRPRRPRSPKERHQSRNTGSAGSSSSTEGGAFSFHSSPYTTAESV